MVSTDTFRVAMLALEITGLVLVGLLLLTTSYYRIHRHPVINALLIVAGIHAAVYIWPGFFHVVLTRQLAPLPSQQNIQPVDPALERFCAADAVILRYIEIVQAAFTVSFTIAMCDLARRSTEPEPTEEDEVYNARFSPVGRSVPTFVLCVGPLLWGLPILFVPIPHFLGRPSNGPIAHYFLLYCSLPNHAFWLASVVLLLTPLCISVFLAAGVGFYVAKFYRSHRNVLTSSVMDLALVVRCAGMGFIIVLSTVLVALNVVYDKAMSPIALAGIAWESIMPIMQFLIFASQKDVLAAWSSILTCQCLASDSDSGGSSYSRHQRRESGTTDAFLPPMANHRPTYKAITISLPGSRLSLPMLFRSRTPTLAPSDGSREKRAFSPDSLLPVPETHTAQLSSSYYLYPSTPTTPHSAIPIYPQTLKQMSYVPPSPLPETYSPPSLFYVPQTPGDIPPTPRMPAPAPPSSPLSSAPNSRRHSRVASFDSHRTAHGRLVPQARQWMARPLPYAPVSHTSSFSETAESTSGIAL